MSKLDLLKLMQTYDGEIEIADFTPQELQRLLDELNAADDEEKPTSLAEFKKKYFEYYDDVKDPTLKRQDW